MRLLRSRSTVLDRIPEPIRVFFARRAAEIGGIALLVFVLAAVGSLATWSVNDPSFNHATAGRVRNLLGAPGAVLSDLTIQLFGIAALAMLLPLLAWSLTLLRHRALGWLRLRIVFWIGGTLAAAAVASALPRTDRWSLPTGLGGAVGDGVLGFARALLGISSGPFVAMLGFGFAALAILGLTAACGYGFRPAHQRRDDSERAPARNRRHDEDDRDAEPGFAIVSIGAVIHALLTAKSAVTRLFARLFGGRSRPQMLPAGAAPVKDWEVADDLPPPRPLRRTAEDRVEPRLDPGFARTLTQPAVTPPRPAKTPPPFDTDDDIEPVRAPPPRRVTMAPPAPLPDDDIDDDEPLPAALPPPPRPAPRPPELTTRVTAPPAPIKPGKRIVEETQPSLLATPGDGYEMPPLTVLGEPKRGLGPVVSADALEQNARLLEGVLEDFGVRGEIINVRPGPVVTLYELEPAPGTKSSRVISLADDIARSMSAVSARVAVIPGRNAIGIELPNQRRETVFLRELLASQDYETSKQRLPVCLGKTIGGDPVIVDLARMPHLLVAGTTGSGKSVAINTMILSLLYRLKPEECRLIMVDPKILELSVYEGIPHLLTPVVTDPKKAVVALKWAVREMDDRYRKMAKIGVRNIDGYNTRISEAAARGDVITRTVETGFDKETGEVRHEQEVMDLSALPYIVVIVDEMADLMMVAGKEIEGAIQRLAQKARAAGIHVVLATQRPSVDVITGTIKANFPTRISFQVTSKIDSRTILGEQGAEQLLGQGDMLFMAGGGRITRVHGPFVSDEEVEKVVEHVKRQGRPQYLEEIVAEEEAEAEAADEAVFDKGSFGEPSGDLYDQAVAVVLRDKKASTSYIQRRLQIGYNRAASLMERMEREGIVGAANHAGKRDILVERGHHGADEDE